MIPRCIHVLADSGAFPSVKSTLFAVDYFIHVVFLHDLLLQRKSTYVSVDASQKFLCTILSKYGTITKMTVMAVQPEGDAMKTVISLIVSVVFARYTGLDFITLYTVTLTALEVYGYWNDTDDKNALH